MKFYELSIEYSRIVDFLPELFSKKHSNDAERLSIPGVLFTVVSIVIGLADGGVDGRLIDDDIAGKGVDGTGFGLFLDK